MKILFLNGPNLNMLGIREPDIYGKRTYADLEQYIRDFCTELNIDCTIRQSNHEGVLVDEIQGALGTVDAIVINPAAYTHTSIAILDALKAVALPAVEVHLSDINSREEFRRHSFVSPVAVATICGKGFDGYRDAAEILRDTLK